MCIDRLRQGPRQLMLTFSHWLCSRINKLSKQHTLWICSQFHLPKYQRCGVLLAMTVLDRVYETDFRKFDYM